VRDDPADFGDRLTYLIRRVDAALSQQLDRDLRAHALTSAQLSALAQLDVASPAPLSGAELSRRSGVTAQSMSAAVAGLLERGLVARAPHPEHGRRLDVTLTPDGLSLLRQVQAETRAAEGAIDLGLSAAEERQLKELLRRVMRAQGLFLPGEPGRSTP
jgi:DNA-binding MarR family transcriptional regulator